MKQNINFFKKTKVIPVVVIDHLKDAVPLAKSIVGGGLPVIEITLRTSVAISAIQAIRDEVPDCIVGAGSILDKKMLVAAKIAGAQFGVSPGMTNNLLETLSTFNLPFLPGAGSISEIMALRTAGFQYQKLFPAAVLGGVNYLKTISGPLADISFCPTGGIDEKSAQEYLQLKNVFTVGGSWVAERELIISNQWEEIRKRAQIATQL